MKVRRASVKGGGGARWARVVPDRVKKKDKRQNNQDKHAVQQPQSAPADGLHHKRCDQNHDRNPGRPIAAIQPVDQPVMAGGAHRQEHGRCDRSDDDKTEPFQHPADQQKHEPVRRSPGRTRHRHGEKPGHDQSAVSEPITQCTGHHAQSDAEQVEDRDDPDTFVERQPKFIANNRQCRRGLADLKSSGDSREDQNGNGNPVGPRRRSVTGCGRIGHWAGIQTFGGGADRASCRSTTRWDGIVGPFHAAPHRAPVSRASRHGQKSSTLHTHPPKTALKT